MSGIIIRSETLADVEGIRDVNRQAFGQGDEATLVDELRESGFLRLSLVADSAGQLLGHILFSQLLINTADAVVHALALAPMAVVPGRQRQGIGSDLVRTGLTMSREAGHRIVVVLGHADFYPRFGFSPRLVEPLVAPFSGPHLMAMELVPGALSNVSGDLVYPPPFRR